MLRFHMRSVSITGMSQIASRSNRCASDAASSLTPVITVDDKMVASAMASGTTTANTHLPLPPTLLWGADAGDIPFRGSV
jgi:hypothetical protein